MLRGANIRHTERMTGILDERDAACTGDRSQLSHVAHLPAEMDRQRNLRPEPLRGSPLNGSTQHIRRQKTRIRINVCEHHLCARHPDDVGRCQKRHRGDDRCVSRRKIKRKGGKMKSRGTAIAGDRMGSAGSTGKIAFEFLNLRPGREELTTERHGDGRYILFVYALSTVRQVLTLRVHVALKLRSSFSAAPSSHSGLFSEEYRKLSSTFFAPSATRWAPDQFGWGGQMT